MLVTRLDQLVESGGFKSERGIVLRPGTVLFISLIPSNPLIPFSSFVFSYVNLFSATHGDSQA